MLSQQRPGLGLTLPANENRLRWDSDLYLGPTGAAAVSYPFSFGPIFPLWAVPRKFTLAPLLWVLSLAGRVLAGSTKFQDGVMSWVLRADPSKSNVKGV